MAQWNQADRILYAKLVYYGPAFGGKTTNLQVLHQLTDPQGKQNLLSIKTADDRTLFFDLLPFDLGEILGYQVAMKLYTVPGQVRYDTTRQVVLAGADAVVFVADSSGSRQDQNVWSLQNLHMNMRAKRLDPSQVPVLFQFNKQDLPDAVPPTQVARWLGLRSQEQGIAAVAVDGRGVVETFMAACRSMLERLAAMADDRTKRELDPRELGRQLDRVFAPYLARCERMPTPVQADAEPRTTIVLEEDDLLQRAVQTGVRLGERLSHETARAARLEREAEAFRRLSDVLRSVGASFERDRIVDSALAASAEILQAPIVTLVRRSAAGRLELERAWGCPEEPLLACKAGSKLLSRMLACEGPCVVEDLASECSIGEEASHLQSLRGLAAVPVETAGASYLVAYVPQPDGLLRQHDVRFLATVAGHLAVGLEKWRLHEELAGSRDQLRQIISDRTGQLRDAFDELRSLDGVKDRFLGNLSHEMKTPLTAVLSSALVLRDYKSSAKERRELIASIISSSETLQRQIDDLFRLVHLDGPAQPLKLADISAEALLREAVELAGGPAVRVQVQELGATLRGDQASLARAVANLIDNAVKFSPAGAEIELCLRPGQLARGPQSVDGLVVCVLDRGPGVAAEDRQRIFAPFEQGGDSMTSKPRGIGLGLHEARTIARRHGGDLEYFPRPDGGSEFRFTVPLQPVGTEARMELAHV